MIWIGIIIGLNLGVILSCLWAYYHHPHNDECRKCSASYSAIIRERDEVIHGLRSTKGRLANELQSMAFRNSGFNAK